MKNFFYFFYVFLIFTSPSLAEDRLDKIPIHTGYLDLRKSAELDLAEDDYARLTEALDFIERQSRKLISSDVHIGSSRVFSIFVKGKSYREIIILGSLLAITRCDLIDQENRILGLSGGPLGQELYDLRSKEAIAMKSYYYEIIDKYAKDGAHEKGSSL